MSKLIVVGKNAGRLDIFLETLSWIIASAFSGANQIFRNVSTKL